MILKYILIKSHIGGSVNKSCKTQATMFLEKYYDKKFNGLSTGSLPRTDKAIVHSSLDSVNSVYGEPCGYEVDKLIQELQIDANDVFYDLGSGTGNVCATVLFGSGCNKAVGIELSDTRHQAAVKIKEQIQLDHPNKMENKSLVLINDNFLNHDYSDATIIFTDSVLFTDKTMNEIENRAIKAPNIRYLVSMKGVYTPVHFKHLKEMNIRASWGNSRMNIYVPK